jgi:hypothetical protein
MGLEPWKRFSVVDLKISTVMKEYSEWAAQRWTALPEVESAGSMC